MNKNFILDVYTYSKEIADQLCYLTKMQGFEIHNNQLKWATTIVENHNRGLTIRY